MNQYENLKSAETLDDVKSAFAAQLEVSPKSDGEYLKGETLEEAASNYLNNIIKQFPGADMDIVKARAIMENKVKEYKEHAGEAQLFYMREVIDIENSTPEGKKILVQVVKIWESQMESLIGTKYVPVGTSPTGLPRFIQHNLTDTPDIKIG